MKRPLARILAVFLVLFASLPLLAQDIASFEKRITVKKLPNGLTLLVMAILFRRRSARNLGKTNECPPAPEAQPALSY